MFQHRTLEEFKTEMHRPTSERFRVLVEGMQVETDFSSERSEPPWLDKDKYRAGQEFFRSMTLGIFTSNFRSLVTGLAVPTLCDVLVLTGLSHYPKKARRRYLDTTKYIWKWYHLEPWNNFVDFDKVNKMHLEALKKVKHMTAQERREKAIEIISEYSEEEKLDKVLQSGVQNFRTDHLNDCEFHIYKKYLQSESIFTQFDMCLVLLAFFGTFVIYPEMFGYVNPSDDELVSFIHFWRVAGFYLGLEDRFNPCDVNSPEEARSLLMEFANHVVLPASLNMNKTSIHMGKSVAKGFGGDFHILWYNLLLAHGIELKNLWHSFSLRQKFIYYARRVFLELVYPKWPVKYLFNYMIHKFYKLSYN